MLHAILRTLYSLHEILTILLILLPQQSSRVSEQVYVFIRLIPVLASRAGVTLLLQLSYRTTSDSNKLAQHALHLTAYAATCAQQDGIWGSHRGQYEDISDEPASQSLTECDEDVGNMIHRNVGKPSARLHGRRV
jgi:hypothetical protein